jgi:hypothetical protein
VLFSKRTLKAILEQTGFQVLKVKTWGGLAKGAAPGWIKRPADVLAKRLGFGDVVLMLGRKNGRPALQEGASTLPADLSVDRG